ncbi:MAG TPA: hypothetical protein VE621_22820 [Bryobacteraceae bacterium]|nr:hypothetical protein [Bryobacteraceae bacterium]
MGRLTRNSPSLSESARTGLPAWLDGIADTGCIATHGSALAVVDKKGNFHVSADNGRTWSCRADGIPTPNSILIV